MLYIFELESFLVKSAKISHYFSPFAEKKYRVAMVHMTRAK